MHRAEREPQEPATARGLHEAVETELQIRRADEADAAVCPEVSRSWLQLRLKDLKAPEVKNVCTESNTVKEEDEKAYKEGLLQKLAQIGDLRLQMSWDEFSCVVDAAAVKTLLHRSETIVPWRNIYIIYI